MVICVGIIGPILVTSFGYFLLFRQVKQVRRAVSAIGGGQRGLGASIHKHDRSNSSEDDRLKLTLTLLCCSLAACWGPLIVINILRVIQVNNQLRFSMKKTSASDVFRNVLRAVHFRLDSALVQSCIECILVLIHWKTLPEQFDTTLPIR